MAFAQLAGQFHLRQGLRSAGLQHQRIAVHLRERTLLSQHSTRSSDHMQWDCEPGHRLVQIHGDWPPRTGCVQRARTVDARTLEVLGGSCGALTSLQCLIADSPYQPVTGLTVGAVYYIRSMAGGGDGNGADMGLAMVSAAPNNECAGAAQLTVRSRAGGATPRN
jgi:hypothetical protein